MTNTGWMEITQIEREARWYCEQLEAGEILLFPALPFELAAADREFLLAQNWGESRLHKNVSYRPAQDRLAGIAAAEPARARLHQAMRNYSAEVVRFLARLLEPYAPHWSLDFSSFRPHEEQGRQLPLHKRNDLLHVDAFPSRPTRGGRILRVFTNLHPSKPRVWLTAERMPALAARFAAEAGLDRIAAGGPVFLRPFRPLGRALGLAAARRSAYDRFMLRFHDYLKENSAFQAGCEKTRLELPPLATWLVFTDAVPHAVLSGQFALEQTFIIPPEALVAPEHAPLRVLEKLCGRPLTD